MLYNRPFHRIVYDPLSMQSLKTIHMHQQVELRNCDILVSDPLVSNTLSVLTSLSSNTPWILIKNRRN